MARGIYRPMAGGADQALLAALLSERQKDRSRHPNPVGAAIGDALGQAGRMYAAHTIGQAGEDRALAQEEARNQALADALAGTQAAVTPGATLQGAPADFPTGFDFQGATPGLTPSADRDQILAMSAAGLSPEEIIAVTTPSGPIRASAGDTFLDPATYQPIASIPEAQDDPTTIREMRAFGLDPANPADQARYFELTGKRGTTVNVGDGGIKVPSGYMLGPDGASVVPIPGGPATRVEGPAAAVTSLVPGALSDLGRISTRIFDPSTGEVDRAALGMMNTPMIGSIPGTEGADLRGAYEGAMDTIIRVRTGAAATADEMETARRTYMPSVLDTEETVRHKMRRLERDLIRAHETAARGRGGAAEAPPVQIPETPIDEPGPVERAMEGVRDFFGATGEPAPTAPGNEQVTPIPPGGALPRPGASFEELLDFYGR